MKLPLMGIRHSHLDRGLTLLLARTPGRFVGWIGRGAGRWFWTAVTWFGHWGIAAGASAFLRHPAPLRRCGDSAKAAAPAPRAALRPQHPLNMIRDVIMRELARKGRDPREELNDGCCPKADLAGATERAAQAAREGNSPEGRPLTTRAAISATGITWAVDIASMTRVA